MNQKGFSAIIGILAIILIVGLIIGASFYIKSNIFSKKANTPSNNTFERISNQSNAINTKSSSNNAGLADPASVNCEQKGGKLEIRTAASGGQYGVCKFNDGTECEEWAYMNGTCKPGQYKVWEETENKHPNLNFNFYTTGFTKDITDQSNFNSWTKNSWTEKENAKYLFLGMTVHNSNSFPSTDKEITLKIEGDINKEITVSILNPGAYSQQIPVYIPLPPQNNVLRISINTDKSVVESNYYDNYVFVSLRDGTTMTERKSFDKVFDYEKQIADQLTCNDLKLINRLNDFPNCK